MTGARLYQALTQVLEGFPFNNEHALVTGVLSPVNTPTCTQPFSLVVLYSVLYMYVPEKGKNPPGAATEAELCAPVLGLDTSARSNKAVINLFYHH